MNTKQIVTVLVGALLFASPVAADDIASSISAAIDEALASRTHDLTANGQRARGCADFGGRWQASMSGGVRCSVGRPITQPFSLILPIDVAQNGCRFSYSDFGGRQRGTIRGNTIRIPKPKFRRGTVFRSGRITGKGKGTVQSQDQATVKISLLFKGEINGIRTNCRIKWTTRFVRLAPPPPPPPPPQVCTPSSSADGCTRIDFNTLLNGTPTSDPSFSNVTVNGLYEPLGVTFRSREDAGPTFSHPLHPFSSQSIVINDFSRPPGGTFNIVADFSPPVHFVSADVISGENQSVQMTAKNAFGAFIGSASSQVQAFPGNLFKVSLDLFAIGEIATVEFETINNPAVFAVGIDNLVFRGTR